MYELFGGPTQAPLIDASLDPQDRKVPSVRHTPSEPSKVPDP